MISHNVAKVLIFLLFVMITVYLVIVTTPGLVIGQYFGVSSGLILAFGGLAAYFYAVIGLVRSLNFDSVF